MKTRASRYLTALRLVAGMVALLVAVLFASVALVSCSPKDSSLRFSDSLKSIDGWIAAGDSKRALSSLKKLSKSAQSAGQWLSIAKRERALKAFPTAAATLKAALKKIPSNTDLAAVLADTLVLAGDLDGACAYSATLEGTPWGTTVAWAEISRASTTNPFSIDPIYWQAAATVTGLPVFYRDAAVDWAMRGNLAAACSAAESQPFVGMAAKASESPSSGTGGAESSMAAVPPPAYPDEALFRATLCYDAGFPDKTLEYLSPADESITDLDRLSLMADAAWRQKNTPLARSLWEREMVEHPHITALPYYNLAVVENDSVIRKRLLESTLAAFPTYYPAVVSYVRSVPAIRDSPLFDPLERELEKAGFRTLEMERKIAERPVTVEEARLVLNAAIAGSGKSPDIRLIIENARMDWFETTDAKKSAAAMWVLLEKYRDDPVLHSWALWYFISLGDAATAIQLNKGATDPDGAYYSGLERAFAGDLDRAEELFLSVANNDGNAWCALANVALIRERKKDFAGAVEKFTVSAKLAPNDGMASRLQYEAARILAESSHDARRAKDLLGYALQIDPSNYRASAMLRDLEAVK